MKTRFIVIEKKGPAWDPSRLRRAQAQWDEHAAFIEGLVADGVVLLAGPLGEADGEDALLVVDAPDEKTIVSTFENDPWIQSGILETRSIQRWTIFVDAWR